MEVKFISFPLEVSSQYSADITEEDLPPRYNRRWTSVMKAKVVAALESGLLTVEEAGRRYNLGQEELLIWQRGIMRATAAEATYSGQARFQRSLTLREAADPLGGFIDIRL